MTRKTEMTCDWHDPDLLVEEEVYIEIHLRTLVDETIRAAGEEPSYQIEQRFTFVSQMSSTGGQTKSRQGVVPNVVHQSNPEDSTSSDTSQAKVRHHFDREDENASSDTAKRRIRTTDSSEPPVPPKPEVPELVIPDEELPTAAGLEQIAKNSGHRNLEDLIQQDPKTILQFAPLLTGKVLPLKVTSVLLKHEKLDEAQKMLDHQKLRPVDSSTKVSSDCLLAQLQLSKGDTRECNETLRQLSRCDNSSSTDQSSSSSNLPKFLDWIPSLKYLDHQGSWIRYHRTQAWRTRKSQLTKMLMDNGLEGLDVKKSIESQQKAIDAVFFRYMEQGLLPCPCKPNGHLYAITPEQLLNSTSFSCKEIPAAPSTSQKTATPAPTSLTKQPSIPAPSPTPTTSVTHSDASSSSQPPNVDTSDIPTLKRLDPKSKGFLQCVKEFNRSLADRSDFQHLNFLVKSILEVSDARLEDQFYQSILYFIEHQLNSNPDQPELSVYYGVKAEHLKHLVERNWPPPRTAGSDEWNGAGMYFSVNPEYVMKFAIPDGRNGRVEVGDRLFLVQYDVLPGRSMKFSSLKNCRGSIPNYESVKSPTGAEILIFDSKHISPKYVLEIEVQSAETHTETSAEGSSGSAASSFVDSMTRAAAPTEPLTNDSVSPIAALQPEGLDPNSAALLESKSGATAAAISPEKINEAVLMGLLSHADSLGARGSYQEQRQALNHAVTVAANYYGNRHPKVAEVLEKLADVHSPSKLNDPAEYVRFATGAKILRNLIESSSTTGNLTSETEKTTTDPKSTAETAYVDPNISASMPEQVVEVRAAALAIPTISPHALPNDTAHETGGLSTDGVIRKGIDVLTLSDSSPEGWKNTVEPESMKEQDAASTALRSAFDEWIRTVTSSSTPASRVFWLKARSPASADDRNVLAMLNNEHDIQSLAFHKCAVNGRAPSDVIRTTFASLMQESREYRKHVLDLISPNQSNFDNYALIDEPTAERSAKQLIFIDLADDLPKVASTGVNSTILTVRGKSLGSDDLIRTYDIVVNSLQEQAASGSQSEVEQKVALTLEVHRRSEANTRVNYELGECIEVSKEIGRFPILRSTSGVPSTLLQFIKTALLSLFPSSIAVVIQSSHPPPDFMRSMLPYVFDYDKSDAAAKKNSNEIATTSDEQPPKESTANQSSNDAETNSKSIDLDSLPANPRETVVPPQPVQPQPVTQPFAEVPSASFPTENVSKSLPEVSHKSGKERVIGYFTGWATHTTQKNSLGFVKRYNPDIHDFQKFVFHESRVECDKNELQYHTMVDFELYRNPEQKVFAQAVRIVPLEKRKEYESKMEEEEKAKMNAQKPAQPVPQQFAAQDAMSKVASESTASTSATSSSGGDSANSSSGPPPAPADVFYGEISQWLGSSWARIKYTPSEHDSAGWNIYNRDASRDKFVEVEVHKNALVMRGDHKNMPKQDVYKQGVYVDFVYRESVGKYAQKVRFISQTVPDDTSHNHAAMSSASSSSGSSSAGAASTTSSSSSSSSSSGSSSAISSANSKGPAIPIGLVAKGLNQSDSGIGGNNSSIPVGTQVGVFFAWSSSSNMHGTIRFSKDAFSAPASTTASAPLHPKGAYDSILFHKNRLLCSDSELKAGTVVTFDCFPSSKRQGEYFAQNVALCTNKQQVENSVIVYLTEAAVKSAKIHHAFFKDWLSGTWGKLLPFEPVSSSMPSASSIPAMPIIDMSHSIDFRSTAILGSVSDFVKEVEVEYRIFPLQGPYPQQVRVVPPEHSYWTQKALEKARNTRK